jgi:4-amino-4-deoxy-L-arabinose transferase-like glycosyltransferase
MNLSHAISKRSPLLFWVGVAGIVGFGSVQALGQYGRSLNNDEPFSANAAHLPLSQMRAFFYSGTNHPVYFLALKAWTRLFGESEVALRLPSLIFFAATIIAVSLIARRLFGPLAGLVSGFLVSISTIGQNYAATARQYALAGLWVALTTLVAIHLMRLSPNASPAALPPAGRKYDLGLWVTLVVLSTLGMLTHPIFAFFLAACGAAALLVSRRAVLLMATGVAVSLALYFILWGPFFFNALKLPAIDWMPVPGLKDLLSGYRNLWGQTNGTVIALGLGLIALLQWPKFSRFVVSPAGRVLIVVAGLTCALPFVVSQWHPVYLDSRTPIIFLPTTGVLVAGLVNLVKPRWIPAAVMLFLAFGAVQAAYLNYLSPDPFPARASVADVLGQAQCGDQVITTGISFGEVNYYFRRLHAPDCLQINSFPAEIKLHPGWLDDKGMLEHRDALDKEVYALADLAPPPPARTWVFYSSQANSPVTGIVKSILDSQLQLSDKLSQRGTFFTYILIYTRKP